MATRKIFSLISVMLISLAAFAQTDALKLRIDGNNYYDETIVRFVSDATAGYDGSYDAWKLFSPNTQVPSLYTRIDSVSPLSINALPGLVRKMTVGVHADVNVAGSYMVTPTEVGAFQPDVCIMLEDMATGNYYDMRSGAAPSFVLAAGNNNGQPRFRIHFSTPLIVSVSDAMCHGSNDGEVMLNKAGNFNWYYSLADSAGNNVASGAGISEGDTLTDLAAGAYTLTSVSSFGCPETNSFIVGQPSPLQPSFVPSDSLVYVSQGTIQFNNTSTAGDTYTWDFGDGSPVSTQLSPAHTYAYAGNFTVTLTASHGICQETVSSTVSILPDITTGAGDISEAGINIFSSGNALVLQGLGSDPGQLSVYDISGRKVAGRQLAGGVKAVIDLHLPEGFYLVSVMRSEEIFVKKVFLAGE